MVEIKIGSKTRFENLLKTIIPCALVGYEVIITNLRYALVGYFITSYPTQAHGIIVIYCDVIFLGGAGCQIFKSQPVFWAPTICKLNLSLCRRDKSSPHDFVTRFSRLRCLFFSKTSIKGQLGASLV